jgi:hypothetical protein
LCGGSDRRFVEITQLGTRKTFHDEPRQGALAGLAGTIDDDDPGVSQRCPDVPVGASR